ncbi:MAG: asparagine--tRNA ligase [Thermodesulfobacteriota bacterium]
MHDHQSFLPARSRVSEILSAETSLGPVLVSGWVRTIRSYKDFAFLELNDGSCLANLQVVLTPGTRGYDALASLATGCSVEVSGEIAASPGKGQKWELAAKSVSLTGPSSDDYPLQKKRHSDEFLRTIAHLRPRTNKYGALFRLRSAISLAIHNFFSERGFCYIHTPVITGSDCEGAGELFSVCTRRPDGGLSSDFFGKEAYLTVSGQLAVEMFALSLGRVYTFGPTFRAENSNTARHAAEFWMIEPEMAFCDLNGDIALAEELLRHLASFVMDKCSEDLSLFSRFIDPELPATLSNISQNGFARMSYTEAVGVLSNSKESFDFPVFWGADLKTEHERYLAETYCRRPVVVTDYPATLKPFYMRRNDDEKTVAAMDILVPRVGEIVGGSQREERYDTLLSAMQAARMDTAAYSWYLDSRKYGTAPHAGFGLGLERLLMLVTGITNIRDVIAYPRTPGNLEY